MILKVRGNLQCLMCGRILALADHVSERTEFYRPYSEKKRRPARKRMVPCFESGRSKALPIGKARFHAGIARTADGTYYICRGENVV